MSALVSIFNRLPDRLRRVTTSGAYIAEIDGLRFIAVMMVLVSHLNSRVLRMYEKEQVLSGLDRFFTYQLSLGNLGVELFFVISGFIIAFPFLAAARTGKTVSLNKYFLRRLTRLEPPYMISLLVIFLFMALTGFKSAIAGRYGGTGASGESLLASLFYVHGLVFGRPSELNPPTWSLELEIQFYLMAPLLIYVFNRCKGVAGKAAFSLLGLAAIVVAQITIGGDAPARKLFLFAYLHFFILGIILCEVINHAVWFKRPSAKRSWDLAGIAGLLLLYKAKWTDPFFVSELLKISAITLIFFAAFRGNLFKRFLANRWIAVIGGMCYTIYLLHLPLMQVFVEKAMRFIMVSTLIGNFVVQLLIFLPLLMVISGIFFLLIEKPCMDPAWPQKLWRKVTGLFGTVPVQTAVVNPQPIEQPQERLNG